MPFNSSLRAGSRVRFISESPEQEPQGTVTLASPDKVVIAWDDEHFPSQLSPRDAFTKLEQL